MSEPKRGEIRFLDPARRWEVHILADGTLGFLLRDPETGEEETLTLAPEEVVNGIRRIARKPPDRPEQAARECWKELWRLHAERTPPTEGDPLSFVRTLLVYLVSKGVLAPETP